MHRGGAKEDREKKGLYRMEEGEYTNEESEGIHKPCYANIQKRSMNPTTNYNKKLHLNHGKFKFSDNEFV